MKKFSFCQLWQGEENLSYSWRWYCLKFCRRSMGDWYDQQRWWNLKYQVGRAQCDSRESVRRKESESTYAVFVCVCVRNFFEPSSISPTIIGSESIFTSVVKYNRSLKREFSKQSSHHCMQYFSYPEFRTCPQDCGIQIVTDCLPLPETHNFFSQLLTKAPQSALFGHNSFLIPHRRQYCMVSTFRYLTWNVHLEFISHK